MICPVLREAKHDRQCGTALLGTASSEIPWQTDLSSVLRYISNFHDVFLSVVKVTLAASKMCHHEQASLGGSSFVSTSDSCWLCPNSMTRVFHSSWINMYATVTS